MNMTEKTHGRLKEQENNKKGKQKELKNENGELLERHRS